MEVHREKEQSAANGIVIKNVTDEEQRDLETNREYITGSRLWLVLSCLTLVTYLMALDLSIIVTAIPRITSDFHSLPDIGWYGSAFLLSNCALQPMTGTIYTKFESKYTFLVFLGVFELGSLICGVARSSTMLIVGRAVAGVGASGITNGALTIMANSAPMHKQPAMLGIIMSVTQIGIISGPLIGGALTQYTSWRWCFYINLPLGVVAAILLLAIKIPNRIQNMQEKDSSIFVVLRSLDLIGFLLFASFAIMALLATQWGGTKYQWTGATIIGLLCGSVIVLIIFGVWEYRLSDQAMIPFSVVSQRIIWCSCCVNFFAFSAVVIFTYYLPIYFQAIRGKSPVMSGVHILPSVLSQVPVALLSGILVGKTGYYLPWSILSAILVAVAAGLISTFTPHTSTVKWIMYQVIGGIGRGCGLQMPIIAIQSNLPPQQISIGIALAVFFQTFGGSVFLTIAQAIFSHSLTSSLKVYAPAVDIETVVKAGATAINQTVQPEEVNGVLLAYNVAMSHDFYLSIGAAVGVFLFSWGIGWKRVNKRTD